MCVNYHDSAYYDSLPTLAGEPSARSATSSFLHGLSWRAVPKYENGHSIYLHKRRSRIPTWSWLSLSGGEIEFTYHNRFAIQAHDLLTLESNIQVFVQKSGNDVMPLQWDGLGKAWLQSESKIIPEVGPFLKIETHTAKMGEVFFKGTLYGDVDVSFPSESQTMNIRLRAFRCNETLRFSQWARECSFSVVGWKLALIHREYIRRDDESESYCLVLEPFGDYWKRAGIFSTLEDCMGSWERETVILC